MVISVHVDMSGVNRLAAVLDAKQKQVAFAAAKTLTQVAKDKLQPAIYAEMRKKFDRPTPFTMKGLRVKPATKQDLTAMVYLKDAIIGGKNPNSLDYIIGQEFTGGPRNRKGIERLLEQAGLISANEYVAPGAGATLDQYGNMSRGQLNQIVSQIRIGLDPYSWKSNSARSRRNVKRSGQLFWSRGGHLARGVWMRDGATVKPILMVIKRPNYRQRIDLKAIADRVVAQEFNPLFVRNLDDALRTAR